MKTNTARYGFFATLIACSILCGGCISSQMSRFYVLHALADAPATRAASEGRSLTLGIGPVAVAKYLDRPQIAERISNNEISFSEFDRWAEPLESNIARVIAENLSLLLGTDRIELFPWKTSTPIDYQVRVNLSRFDGKSGDQAVLVTRWTVAGRDGNAVLVDRKSEILEPISGRGYEPMVQAQNKALEKLSRDIASAIKGLAQ
ncbi:MAG: PqiC family protein [Pseudomonadota bacterium]